MSSFLWRAFYEDDVDTFRQLLETAVYHARPHAARGGGGGGPSHHSVGSTIASPSQYGTSPVAARGRKALTPSTPAAGGFVLTKSDINWRDALGLTLLHHAASSTLESAVAFATALIQLPHIDLYLQDLENGWTALHRAFYFGNITIARLILERDTGAALGKLTGASHSTLALVKIKDKEGLGPLDLYAATIKDRTLRPETSRHQRSRSTGSDEDRVLGDAHEIDGNASMHITVPDVHGDQLFHFGSNRNVSLGFGDQDDRQYPERVNLRRPEHLLRRFYEEQLDQHEKKWSSHDPSYQSKTHRVQSMWVEDIPWMARSRPLVIQDVHMSKLHTAVLTTDTESNLYMCGHGQGGRLGTGDERTRFHFVCIEGGALTGKRIATVALGQNHTLALSAEGETFSWGNNGYGQLGYSLPKTKNDEDPISAIPRQVFGPLKRENVVGIAASRLHSVAHTSTALYVMGKNDGQLGIVDSDARSLEIQVSPRRVAASLFASTISSVTAIDRATVCLLENHDVWVFANYGYAKVQFPLESFTNYFLKQSFLVTTYDSAPNRVKKVTAEGDTICALSTRGEIYTVTISSKLDIQSTVSTTNPSKIRSAITSPQRIWSPKKSNMAARDVGLDTDGSIILTTAEGSVWKRTKRVSIKDASLAATSEYKPKDYKFSRIPGLTRALAVRSSGHGAFAAIRQDCDVLKTQIVIEDPALWKTFFPLLSLARFVKSSGDRDNNDDETRHRFWQGSQKPSELLLLKKAIIGSANIEGDLKALFEHGFANTELKCDAFLATSTSDVTIPIHRFILTARSRVLRRGFRNLCETSTFTIPDLAQAELNDRGQVVLMFQGTDILSLVDLALYLYTDTVIDFWHLTKSAPKMAYTYRQVRAELMKIATKLELTKLEPAVRQMVEPSPCLNLDLELAYDDPAFFFDGDVVVQLEDDEVRAHSVVLCARCPFFEGLFMGRAGGRWLDGRDDDADVHVDLRHIGSKTFDLVLRHMYCDAGSELFDEVVSTDLDEYLDTVLDVLSAANELMLDRLSQIAQAVIGQFVNVRNVCDLLNAISPSSVREFKDAGLEYLCLNLEAMLQGHHLNGLDEDLQLELDEVVRANQLACMPFAKSGRSERLLFERHPELAALVDRNRRAKLDSISLRTKFQDMATFTPGSLGEDPASSPVQQRARRRSSNVLKTDLDRQSLKTKPSSKDMMFEMDDEFGGDLQSPRESPAIRPMTSPRGLEPMPEGSPPEDIWYDSKGKVLPSPRLAPQSSVSTTVTPRTPRSPLVSGKTPPNPGKPWNLTPLPGGRSDMRNIMSQTASGRTSSLSQGLASVATSPLPDLPAPFSLPAPKMSQKDRKRMQHIQQQATSVEPASSSPTTAEQKSFSWQTVTAVTKQPGLQSLMESESSSKTAAKSASSSRSLSTPQLTMRQTVANLKPSPISPRPPIIGPGHPSSSPQQSAVSDSSSKPQPTSSSTGTTTTTPHPRPSSNEPSSSNFSHSKPIPQSIRHQQPIVDASLWGLSISEILAEQQAEKKLIKEATAKRDLQEIQAEQEFQEWWDKESRRVQAENEVRTGTTAAAGGPAGNNGKATKRGKGRGAGGAGGGSGNGGGGRGGRAKGKADANAHAKAAPARDAKTSK